MASRSSIYGPLCINVMRWFEHRRGFAVGLVTAGEGIGGTIWPPVFRHFNETVGWRDTYLWFGVFVLVTALPLSVVLWRAMPARGAGPRNEGGRTVGSHAVAPTNEGGRTVERRPIDAARAGVTRADDVRVRSAPTKSIRPGFARAVVIDGESQAPAFATATRSRM